MPICNTWSDKSDLPYIFRITDILRRVWCNGFVRVEVARDPSGKYISKYISKQSSSKVLKSKFYGRPSDDKIAELRRFPKLSELSIFSSKTGKSYNIPVVDYLSTLSYPSICRSVSPDFRSRLIEFNELYNLIKSRITPEHPEYRRFISRYREFVFVSQFLGYCNPVSTINCTSLDDLFALYKFVYLILKSFDYDFSTIIHYKHLRDEHILYSNSFSYETDIKSYSIILENARLTRHEKDGQ